MATDRIKKTDDEWIKIVKQQKDSGMKPSDFCKSYGHEYKTFINARARVKARIKIEEDLKIGSSFLDKIQKMDQEPLTNNKQNIQENVNSDTTEEILENESDGTAGSEKNYYDKLIGGNDEVELISSTIIRKTQYVLDNELNKMITVMGTEKDLKQINVQKLKDLSVAVLKTVYQNDIQKRRLELEIIRSNIEAEKLLIEKEKLHLEKLKLGLVKDESQTTDNGFVEALKEQDSIWEDIEEDED